jgi:hypothetical protein|tara:strand:- start:483 stop:626 length:144 start_codon:yes stop_codon:yes gene_type:complete
VLTIVVRGVILTLPTETDLETTADGNKGESGGRDQRVKAFLRVDDKK